ncbi:MAG: Kae1-associated kinase Bud32 [Desulfurococcaceae archaeon]|uniref:non-specific serine/threonine protein kinase n=1 Tax=Staphylothermus marinus TaxID=2280 RepID=A0A7C4JM99_STAMA
MVNDLSNILDFGAESLVYVGSVFNMKVIVKHRISKPYRDAYYDKLFRESRTRIEARVLLDLSMNGLNVPKLIAVDLDNNVLIIEYIDGVRMDQIIEKLSDDKLRKYSYDIGYQVGRMHSLSIYHGDLTLANIMVSRNDKIYIIDFGLAGYSRDVEEYAIDVHLLKRSVEALVPSRIMVFMDSFLKGYAESYSGDYKLVLKRLREVELRGRYVEARIRRGLRRDRYVE